MSDDNEEKNKDKGKNNNNNRGGNESKAARLSKQKVKANRVKVGTELIMPVKITVTHSDEYGSELPFNGGLWLINGRITLPGTTREQDVAIVCGHSDEYLYVTVPDDRPEWRKKLSYVWSNLGKILSGRWHTTTHNKKKN